MPSRAQAEFLNLPFQQKLEFLYGLPARQKRDLILAAPEAERLVQSFAPETLYYTLKEIGSADAGDLLSLALPEQVRSLFDLDCWSKDRPNFARMREWIEALAEAGRRRMADGLMELDMEMVALLLRSYIKVHRLDDPNASEDPPSNRYVQFDEHYLIEFIRSDAISQHISDFLEEVFERSYPYFAGLMEETYWGVVAELEEQAYQFRSSRLADRGFPDFYEAQSVFAYLNPREFLSLREQFEPPSRADMADDDTIIAAGVAPVSPGADNSLFNTALTAGFAAQGKRQVRAEMALVTNQVLVARAVDFGDLDAVRLTVEMTHDYLNLGLEHLAAGDLASAIEHLRDTHLKLLFRLGVSLTIDLRKRAELTFARLGLPPALRSREVTFLDSPYRESLAALFESRPRFYTGLDTAGHVELRNFGTMRDIHLAYAMLDQIDAMARLFRMLLHIEVESPRFRGGVAGREIRLSQILLTAFVRLALDGELEPRPLEASRLLALHAAVMTQNGRPAHLSAEFRHRIEATLDEYLDEETRQRSSDFVNACLNMLEEEFAHLDPREIDPRFLSVLLLQDS
ncbi:MAG TPA: DUF6178 family protein [Candidatus Binataceae bacterium]|nr:DUF6178 family protein [Candidatus Binataceae bacterium]